MLFFKKKAPEKMPSAGKGLVPMERTRELSTKGFSEPEIIDILRGEGYSAEEIDKSLTESLRNNIVATPQPAQPAQPTPEPVSALPMLEQLQPRAEMPAIPEQSLPDQYYSEYSPEEYIDYIIRERTEEIDEKMNQFLVKHAEVEKRINEVYEQISTLSKNIGLDQQLFINKIDSFREVVDDVSARLNSLEKAFKETLPSLIEAVRTLSDLVQRFKREA